MKTVEVIGAKEAEALMDRLPKEMQGQKMIESMRASGNVVKREAKRRVPVGDERHNRGKKAFKDTIGVVVRHYSNGVFYMLVGAAYPAGAHSHLVEFGHDVVISRGPNKGRKVGVKAAAKEFMAPAIDSTKTETRQVFFSKLEQLVVKAGG